MVPISQQQRLQSERGRIEAQHGGPRCLRVHCPGLQVQLSLERGESREEGAGAAPACCVTVEEGAHGRARPTSQRTSDWPWPPAQPWLPNVLPRSTDRGRASTLGKFREFSPPKTAVETEQNHICRTAPQIIKPNVYAGREMNAHTRKAASVRHFFFLGTDFSGWC